MRSRPIGVTFFAILLFGNAAFYAVLAVLSIVNHHALAALLSTISPGGAGPAIFHLSMGKFGPIYYLAMTFLTVAAGMGFWRLWEWTRISILVLIGINLVGAVFESIIAIRSGNGSLNAVPAARIVLSVLISLLVGWYLLSPKVRAAFRRADS